MASGPILKIRSSKAVSIAGDMLDVLFGNLDLPTSKRGAIRPNVYAVSHFPYDKATNIIRYQKSAAVSSRISEIYDKEIKLFLRLRLTEIQ
jgi:hypothetical protein